MRHEQQQIAIETLFLFKLIEAGIFLKNIVICKVKFSKLLKNTFWFAICFA
jgi:hypothetical protein